ncbi:MAG: sulfurtransferase TusA family protein [Actinobacteria bacterium]|nr:sulfurtransferase TusA family protein [Actinomycetota bacterium]
MPDLLDLRGLSCPQPVVESRNMIKKISSGDSFHVLVDTGTSRDNVKRIAVKEGCDVAIEEGGSGGEQEFLLIITMR